VLHVALALFVALTSLAAHAVSETDLLPSDRAFPLTVKLSAPQQVIRDFRTHTGCYLYRDRFDLVGFIGADAFVAHLKQCGK